MCVITDRTSADIAALQMRLHSQCMLCGAEHLQGFRLAFSTHADGHVEATFPCRRLYQGYTGYPARSVEECKHLVGEGPDMFARGALPPQARDADDVTSLVIAYRAEYAQKWARKTRPYVGIVDLLDGLIASRIPIAILSNKRDAVVKQEVSFFLPNVPFAELRGARPSVLLKPDPTAALLLARMLGTDPRQVVFVGDTKTDMQTAVSAGMVAVGALWGFRAADELRSNGAQCLMRCPGDILSLLRSSNTEDA